MTEVAIVVHSMPHSLSIIINYVIKLKVLLLEPLPSRVGVWCEVQAGGIECREN